MALDAAAAEASNALRAAGIQSILLKGPVIADWLYDEPWQRPYGDIDLLVAPDNHNRAARMLQGLGYRDFTVHEPGHLGHSSIWRRQKPAPAEIDLHWRLHWIRGDLTSWSALSADVDTLKIGQVGVDTLAPHARAMMLALHAAQHGIGWPKSIRDLERAVARVDEPTWSEAARLSRRLGVDGVLAVGLRLVPKGIVLADRLALGPSSSVEAHLLSSTPDPTSLGWMRLLEERSLRSALQLAKGEVLPSPEFVRIWSSIARRGKRGLVGAYLGRPFWLLWHAPAGIRDLARARRAAAGEEPER
jgi:hypothetical protein